MTEIWRDVDGYDGKYQVSNCGRVRSFKYKMPRIMKLAVLKVGYPSVHLQLGGKSKLMYIHRLVAQAFVDNPEGKPQINHINGDKTDNHAENLEWCTRSENMRHAVAMGLLKVDGENNHNSKLTDEQARYIRENPDGLNIYELARLFGVDDTTISHVQCGKSYRNIGGKIRKAKPHKHTPRIPDEVRDEIRHLYIRGSHEFSSRALAKKYGVSKSTILDIIHET